MRNYTEFTGLWRAPLFHKPFYQDVALNWRGIGALYLALLAMLTWLIVLIKFTVIFSGFLANEAPAVLKDFPTIHITKGIASSDVPQPYIMKDEKGHAVFVLDTTGQITEPPAGARLLLTRTEIVQVDGMGNTQRRPLSAFPDMVIDQQWLLGWAHTGRNLLIPTGMVCCVGATEAWRLVFALLLAAIGLALNKAFGGGLSYAALLRLAIVSMTGPIFLDTLLMVLGIPLGCWEPFLSLALTFGYMVFAVKAGAEIVKPAAPVGLTQWPPGMPPPPLPPQSPNPPTDFDQRFP